MRCTTAKPTGFIPGHRNISISYTATQGHMVCAQDSPSANPNGAPNVSQVTNKKGGSAPASFRRVRLVKAVLVLVMAFLLIIAHGIGALGSLTRHSPKSSSKRSKTGGGQ
jgi:hypothetical protein